MPDREEIVESILSELRDEEIESEDIEICERILDETYHDLDFPINEVTIDYIRAQHFRTLDDKEVWFDGEDTVLFGENDHGKTTTLEAIRFNLFGRQEKHHQRITFTDPIQQGEKTLQTTGSWSVDTDDYLIHRTMNAKGRGYKGHDQPKLNKDPSSESDIPFKGADTQQDVSEAFGLWPIESKDFGRYNIFSLFCLLAPNYKDFVKWQRKKDYLDLLFGINLAAPINQSEQLRKDEYGFTDREETAPADLKTAQSREKELKNRLAELREEKEEAETKLTDKQSELRSLKETLDGQNELGRLESEKLRLQRQINKLESERQETRGDLRETRLRIERHEEIEMGEDLHSTAANLQKLMSIPDRCPICTNDVEDHQRRRLLESGDCPLCEKEVPENRIEIGTERDVEESIIEKEKHQEKIADLQKQERELEGDLRLLDSRVEDFHEQLENVNDQIEESDLNQLIDRRDELEDIVSRMEKEATSLQVEINAKEEELEDVQDQIEDLEEAYKSRRHKSKKKQILSTFEKVVNQHIKRERASLRNDLEEKMEGLLSYFEHGKFANAKNVVFDSEGDYEFTVIMEDGEDIPSDRHNEFSNEGKIIALLFHTAVLKCLAQQSNTIPIRMFLFDSPYFETPDTGNAPDITTFLNALPEELPEYQVIVTVTDSAMADREMFSEQYEIVDF